MISRTIRDPSDRRRRGEFEDPSDRRRRGKVKNSAKCWRNRKVGSFRGADVAEERMLRRLPLRKVGTSGGAAIAAAQMNRPPDSKGFRRPIRDTTDNRFSGGENGTGADTAEG